MVRFTLILLLIKIETSISAGYRKFVPDDYSYYEQEDYPSLRNDRFSSTDDNNQYDESNYNYDKINLAKLFEKILQFKKIVIESDENNSYDNIQTESMNHGNKIKHIQKHIQQESSVRDTPDQNTCKEYNDNLEKLWETISKYVNNPHDKLSKMALHNIALMIEAYLEHQKPVHIISNRYLRDNSESSEVSKLIISLIQETLTKHGDSVNNASIKDLIMKYLKPIVFSAENTYCNQANDDKLTMFINSAYKIYINSKCPHVADVITRTNDELKGKEYLQFNEDNRNKNNTETKNMKLRKTNKFNNEDISTSSELNSNNADYIDASLPSNTIYKDKNHYGGVTKKLKVNPHTIPTEDCDKNALENFLFILQTIMNRYIESSNCNSVRSDYDYTKIYIENNYSDKRTELNLQDFFNEFKDEAHNNINKSSNEKLREETNFPPSENNNETQNNLQDKEPNLIVKSREIKNEPHSIIKSKIKTVNSNNTDKHFNDREQRNYEKQNASDSWNEQQTISTSSNSMNIAKNLRTKGELLNSESQNSEEVNNIKSILKTDLDILFNKTIKSLHKLSENSAIVLPSIINNADKSYVEMTYALHYPKVILFHPKIYVKQTIPYKDYLKLNSKITNEFEIIKAIKFSPLDADVQVLQKNKQVDAIRVINADDLIINDKKFTSDYEEIKDINTRLDVTNYDDYDHLKDIEHGHEPTMQVYTDPKIIRMFKTSYLQKQQNED